MERLYCLEPVVNLVGGDYAQMVALELLVNCLYGEVDVDLARG